MPRSLLHIPAPIAGPELIGWTAATDPVNFANAADGGTDITVPKPTGTAEGDLMLAHVFGATSSPPTGWTNFFEDIWSKTAGASEPSEYTWTRDIVGGIRSGIIATFRNAQIGDFDVTVGNNVTTLSFPTVTTTKENSILLCMNRASVFVKRTFFLVTVDAPLVLGEHHSTWTAGPYVTNTLEITGSTEEGLSIGAISGRTHTASENINLARNVAIVIEVP